VVADPMTAEQMGDERFDVRVAALAFASVRMLIVLGLWQRIEREGWKLACQGRSDVVFRVCSAFRELLIHHNEGQGVSPDAGPPSQGEHLLGEPPDSQVVP
jgi:hypothetical protein